MLPRIPDYHFIIKISTNEIIQSILACNKRQNPEYQTDFIIQHELDNAKSLGGGHAL